MNCGDIEIESRRWQETPPGRHFQLVQVTPQGVNVLLANRVAQSLLRGVALGAQLLDMLAPEAASTLVVILTVFLSPRDVLGCDIRAEWQALGTGLGSVQRAVFIARRIHDTSFER